MSHATQMQERTGRREHFEEQMRRVSELLELEKTRQRQEERRQKRREAGTRPRAAAVVLLDSSNPREVLSRYPSIKAAALANGIKPTALAMALSHGWQTYRYVHGRKIGLRFVYADRSKRPASRPRRESHPVKSLTTGQHYPSVYAAVKNRGQSKYLHCRWLSLRRAIVSGRPFVGELWAWA